MNPGNELKDLVRLCRENNSTAQEKLYKLFYCQAMIANVCGNDYVNKYTELPKK